jgi:peptidoglycan/LPS O-acetylase OafA/YrhL
MESERTPYFPALDGLRALSVLLVVYQHAANKTPAMRRFQGNLGVDIFFVLSGFLITFLLNREKCETGKVDLAAFYVRRAFRILPIYSVVLATYILLTRFSGYGDKWQEMKGELPYFLTFCNELAPTFHYGPFSLTWTLGIEEKFYLVWPFFFFIALALTRWRGAIIAALYLFMVALRPESYRFGQRVILRSHGGVLPCACPDGLPHGQVAPASSSHACGAAPACVVPLLLPGRPQRKVRLPV